MVRSFNILRHSRKFGYLLLLGAVVGPCHVSAATDFRVDLSQIELNIEQARSVASEGKGLISDIAAARLETLLLTKALLEIRELAEKGSQVKFIEIPVNKIDNGQADSILADINQTIDDIQATEDEVKASGGLVQVLAVTRLETERLTLAQLKLAYYQAAYGIALPRPEGQHSATHTAVTAQESDQEEVQVAWADARYPDIDYSLPIFRQAHKEGVGIAGWWTIYETKAPIDDSPMVLSYNQSLVQDIPARDDAKLLLRCLEGESAVIYLPGEFVSGKFGEDRLNVSTRIDDNPAQTTSWSELTNNKGAGLFGSTAEDMMRKLYDSSKLFLRLQDRTQAYDSLFELAGVDHAIDAVADACGWTPQKLTKGDYSAIQSILSTAGYSVGVADGVWGKGSKKAMKLFQKAAGLHESGAPSPETLKQLGYDLLPERQEEEVTRSEQLGEREADTKRSEQLQQEQRELVRLRNLYFNSIRQRVERSWRKPPGTSGKTKCKVSVVQSVGGEVLQVGVEDCEGGSAALRKSVENAVRAASPLPPAPDPKLFNRSLTFYFQAN